MTTKETKQWKFNHKLSLVIEGDNDNLIAVKIFAPMIWDKTKASKAVVAQILSSLLLQSKIDKINGITYRIAINPENPWIDRKDESNLITGQSQLTHTGRVQKIDLLLE